MTGERFPDCTVLINFVVAGEQMAKDIQVDETLWEQFERAAKEQRRNPVRLLMNYMREYLEMSEDRKLDEEIRRDVRKSGYREAHGVELARQIRADVRARRGKA